MGEKNVKFFNTDGLRGNALEIICSNMVFKIGQYIGMNAKKVIIGYDTRQSSPQIADLVINGIITKGTDIVVAGVCPTPYINYCVKNKDFDYGIMITASHNPYFDNGIKIIGSDGKKLSLEEIEKLKKYLATNDNIEFSNQLGKIEYQSNINEYYQNRIDRISVNNKKILVDLANGGYSSLADYIKLNNVTIINNNPNGMNINDHCGSMYPKILQQKVIEGNYDYGIAFDGDGDRMIVVNSKSIFDGDDLISFFSEELNNEIVVITKQSNKGLIKKLEKNKNQVEIVDVGDHNVTTKMMDYSAKIGGEASGHIIFQELFYSDGLFAMVNFINLVNKKEIKSFKKYYNFSKSISHESNIYKKKEEIVSLLEKIIDDDDYLLVRESGTEDKLRINLQTKKKYLIKTIEDIFSKLEKNLCVE